VFHFCEPDKISQTLQEIRKTGREIAALALDQHLMLVQKVVRATIEGRSEQQWQQNENQHTFDITPHI